MYKRQAPFDGVISKIHKPAGEIVQSAELIAEFEKVSDHSTDNEAKQHLEPTLKTEIAPEPIAPKEEEKLNGPTATKLLKENNLVSDDVVASGKGGRVTKADVVNHLSESSSKAPQKKQVIGIPPSQTGRDEERVPMSRLRATIAKRLLSVKQETAMLTTFNEVDMQPIKDLRAKYGKEFEEEHGVKLGFMGFFVLASVQALKKFPLVNASIDGNDIVYHGYQDVGVAVSTERGLVVPVIRDADNLTMAQVEQSILEYAGKARDGKLGINDMQGGTFTISNGGIYGNLLSTPILNAPQTAILGMHKIQDRPVALDGEVVIRPMMYLAMSYDHRLLDGKEAVSFLIAIKDQLESPERLLLNL